MKSPQDYSHQSQKKSSSKKLKLKDFAYRLARFIFPSFFKKPPRQFHNLSRNEKCWCGSGKKYKKCHLVQDEENKRNEAYQEEIINRNEQNYPERGRIGMAERGYNKWADRD